MSAKKLTSTALISCLAFLVMLVFKVPVSFLSFEMKDVVIAIGALYLGTRYGITIAFVVAFIEMITVSSTGIIGFFMNFVATVLYVVPISYFYNKKNRILIGIILGTILMSIGMFLFNLVITPIYMSISLEETIPLLFTLITPFNIIKGIINGLLIFIIHKPLLKLLKRVN